MDESGLIFGRYEVHELIGRGGMAEVYRAYAVGAAGFRRPVVIKKILPRLSENLEFVDMFIAEASTAALLVHPNIVQVFDLGEHGGDLFMVMELVPGTDLGTLVRAYKAEERTAPPELVAFVMVDVCKALECAHGHRDEAGSLRPVIHRDVSPHNVMLSTSGAVKLGDFGLALPTGDVRKTTPGIIKGKLGYMSPEQAEGARDLDGRSDLFSLGIVMYEALSGRRLFQEASPADTVRAVRRAEIAPLEEASPGVPPKLADLVRTLLAKPREDRPETAADVRRLLLDYLRTVSPPVGPDALAAEVQRVAGRPKVAEPQPEDSDAWTLVREAPAGSGRASPPATSAEEPPPRRGRREMPSRVPMSLPVRARFGATTYTLQTADISAGGFFVVTDRPPALHDLVQLKLILPPESAELTVRAMVVHAVTGQDAGERRVPAGMGVQFYDLDDDASSRWERFYEGLAADAQTGGAAHPPTPLSARVIEARRGERPRVVRGEPPPVAGGRAPEAAPRASGQASPAAEDLPGLPRGRGGHPALRPGDPLLGRRGPRRRPARGGAEPRRRGARPPRDGRRAPPPGDDRYLEGRLLRRPLPRRHRPDEGRARALRLGRELARDPRPRGRGRQGPRGGRRRPPKEERAPRRGHGPRDPPPRGRAGLSRPDLARASSSAPTAIRAPQQGRGPRWSVASLEGRVVEVEVG